MVEYVPEEGGVEPASSSQYGLTVLTTSHGDLLTAPEYKSVCKEVGFGRVEIFNLVTFGPQVVLAGPSE